jgi:AbiU2
MGNIITQRQIRNAKRKAMPHPLGDVHHHLANEVRWLHIKWADYCRLYLHSKDVVGILNSTAPTFFSDLQRMLWEDVILHLCRLTDSPTMTTKKQTHERLTFKRLVPSIPNRRLQKKIDRLLSRLSRSLEFARQRRNHKLAHLTLPIPKPPQIRRGRAKNVDRALELMRDILDAIEGTYMKDEGPGNYETIEALGSITALLHFLQKGMEVEGPGALRRMNL